MTDPYINADALPGLADAWDVWTGADHDLYGCACDTCRGGPFFRRPDRFDAQIPAHRDFLARRVAELLGVPPGDTVPEVEYNHKPQCCDGLCWEPPNCCPTCPRKRRLIVNGRGIECPVLPLDDCPDYADLLLAVARWLSTEIRAGRVVPAETGR